MVRFLSSAELLPGSDADAQDAELSDDRVFELRDAHVLYFDGDGEGAWRAQFPYLAWVREPGGDRFGLAAGELARIVLPFVRLVPPDVNNPRLSAADVVFVTAQPGPEAWTRWLRAIMDAQISPQPDSLSLWLREAASLRRAFTLRVRTFETACSSSGRFSWTRSRSRRRLSTHSPLLIGPRFMRASSSPGERWPTKATAC